MYIQLGLKYVHCISNTLKRGTNKAFTKVVGDNVNRGAGYGLEISCVYSLYELMSYAEIASQ